MLASDMSVKLVPLHSVKAAVLNLDSAIQFILLVLVLEYNLLVSTITDIHHLATTMLLLQETLLFSVPPKSPTMTVTSNGQLKPQMVPKLNNAEP
jgi:hypothetical protein